MSAKKFQTMSELARMVHEKITRLESGNLSAEELSGLSDELRDLYDRIVVLRYKAMEKGLKVTRETTAVAPVAEKPIEAAPIKFTVSDTPKTEVKPQEIVAPKVEFNPVAKPQEEKKPEPVVEKPVQTSFFEPVTEKKETSLNEKAASDTKVSIAEKYAAQSKTSIAEKFAAEQKMTLADKLKMTRINDLRSAIGINQKFLFMNDLFEGENTVFNNAINRLNSCNSGDEARSILNEYSVKYGWEKDSERAQQFYELIERRYL